MCKQLLHVILLLFSQVLVVIKTEQKNEWAINESESMYKVQAFIRNI